jgi:hypothetical protein
MTMSASREQQSVTTRVLGPDWRIVKSIRLLQIAKTDNPWSISA